MAVFQSVMEYYAMSDRILLVRFHGQPLDLSIIQGFAPTSASTEKSKWKMFYSDLKVAYGKCGRQDNAIVMRDMNVKDGSEQDPVKEIVGSNGLGERN